MYYQLITANLGVSYVNYAIIMAGGRGERFWPLSRGSRPKQFLKLTSDKTMLEETIERVAPLIQLDNVRIVTTEAMTKQVLTGMPHVPPSCILAEPVGRNTCLAVGLAAVHLRHDNNHAVMVVLSADHLIRPAAKLLQILRDGMAIASMEDALITIGIVPTRPDTGYGYIKFGNLYKQEGESSVYDVVAFTEKPKAVLAQEYYFSKHYFWNSGMFIWSASAILKAIHRCVPEMGELLETYAKAIGTDRELAAREELYKSATSISIDYAVLEHADNVKVIKGDFVWDDVGSWNALERYKDRDSDNNVQIGETVLLNTYETTVYNDAPGLVACIGVSDIVVVRSGETTLVVHKTKTANVKELLAKLADDEKYNKYL
jgi:mannose-1-phosphate guanylyltransferase